MSGRIADAARIASAMIGDEVNVVRRVPSFAGNRVYRVRTATEAFFVKLAAAGDINRELAVLQAVAARGVAVPEVIAGGADERDVPHLVTREVPGEPLAPDKSAALRGPLAVVHAIPVSGYGLVQDRRRGGDLFASATTWLDVVTERAACGAAVTEAGLLDPDLDDRVLASVRAHRAELQAVVEPRLLHGDMTTRHVLADASGITAIIDWGDATSGDPRFDIGRLIHAAVGSHGIDRSIELAALACDIEDANAPTLLLTYGAVFAVWSMYGELTSSDPYQPFFPAQEAVLRTMLDAIDLARSGATPVSW